MAQQIAESCKGCVNDQPLLLDENIEVAGFFKIVSGQWRIASGMGVAYLGLDYGAVKLKADAYGFELNEVNMRKIEIIEAVVLNNLNKEKRNVE